jgi:glycosyltransferase involved in cell wall biosynthesis
VTIALDATPLSVPTGGVARYTLELSRALAAKFPQDTYWLLSDQPVPAVVEVPSNLRIGGSKAFRKWWLWGLPRTMAQLDAKLFHGTDFSVPYVRLRPSVMTVHDLSPWKYPEWQPDAGRVRSRTPKLLRFGLATMVITPSEAVRREAIEYFGLAAGRVVAVPLAASRHFRPVPSQAPVRPYFLFVGTLEPRKNIGGIVEAWRDVRKAHDVDLVLAGRVRSDFVPPGEEPGLEIRGAVDEADLPSLYSNAVACLYPSLYEGFGLPVLEAMQCGGLVIASRDPAIQEVAGDAAMLVDAGDTRGLVEAMKAALKSPAAVGELREKSVARAREFSWERTAVQTREVYDAAICVF